MTHAPAASNPGVSRVVTLNFRPRVDESGANMLWFASWIVGDDGSEGEWFFSGSECLAREFNAPAAATGVRIRRWPSPGLDPEYVDIRLSKDDQAISDRGLQFDRRQAHSMLAAESMH